MTSRTPAARRLTFLLVVGALGLGLGLTGCSGGDEGADPAPNPSTATDETPGTPSSSGTGDTGDTGVVSATGPLLDQEHVSLRLPQGWQRDKKVVTFQVDGFDPKHRFDTVSIDDLVTIDPGASLAQLARVVKKDSSFKDGTILDPVMVDGVRMSHVVSGPSYYLHKEQFDAIAGDAGVSITCEFDTSESRAHQQLIIDSVLAGVHWKS